MPKRRAWVLIVAAGATAVVLAAVLVVANRDDPSDTATSDTTATTAAPTTTSVERTTTAPPTTATTEPTATTPPSPAVDGELVARGDIDGDGHDEMVVRQPGGAYTDMIALLTIADDGTAVPVTLNGTPAAFPVGASVRHMAGLRCDATSHSVTVYSAETEDGEGYEVSWQQLRLDHDTLTETGTGHDTAHHGDALFTSASTVDCSDM